MNWEKAILDGSESSGVLEDLLHPSEFVDDWAFVSKLGYVIGVIEVDPVPFEVMDEGSLDTVCRRMEAAIRGISPEIRVYQYLLKSEIQAIPRRAVPESAELDRLTTERSTFLMENGPLYEVRAFIALCYEGRPDSWKRFLFPTSKAIAIDREIRERAKVVRTYADGLIVAMRGAVTMTRLDAPGIFAFLRKLLNYGPEQQSVVLQEPWDLARQLSTSRVDVRGPLSVGRQHARIWTITEPQRYRRPNIWRGFLSMPCSFILVSEWLPLSDAKTQAIIKSKKTHLAGRLRSLRSGVSDVINKNGPAPAPEERLIDEGKTGLIKELGDALKAISKTGLYFGHWSMTICVYHEQQDTLRAAAAHVASVVHPQGAQITEHMGKSALCAWLAMVPGHERINLRRIKLDNITAADSSFLFGPAKGEPRNEFLKDESLALLTTSAGTLYHANFHQSAVGHWLMTGRPEAGKTFATQFLVAQAQKYAPNTVIFDITNAFRGLTAAFGGSYVELGRATGNNASINPFCLPPVDENIAFLSSFVRMLIESDKGPTLTATETEDVYAQVKSLMTVDLPPGHRRLGNLQPLPHLALRLARWVRTSRFNSERAGQYANLFDNEVDTLTFARFQTFSFPAFDRDREALDALLYYALHRSLDTIYRSDRPSFVVLDEARNFIRHPITQRYILDALANWRKQNASLGLVLHSISDVPPDVMRQLAEKCLTRIHLANPGIDLKAWRQVYKMSATEARAITGLIPRNQVLVEGAGVMRLVCDPYSLARFSTGLEKAVNEGENQDAPDDNSDAGDTASGYSAGSAASENGSHGRPRYYRPQHTAAV